MRARAFDPRRLDIEAFARDGGRLEGATPLRSFSRLNDSSHADAAVVEQRDVTWLARGEQRQSRAGEVQTWLIVRARAELTLQCQRCLGPLDVPLEIDRALRFVRGEAQAAELDAEVEEDVLALQRWIDLQGLIEDELLLAMPLVPRHDRCPQPLPMAPQAAEAGDPATDRPRPFERLAALKRRGRP